MPFRPLIPEDRVHLEKLLRNNPYKQNHIQYQKLNVDSLVQFHLDSIYAQSADPDSPVWFFERSGRYGLMGIKSSKVYSEFFGEYVFSLDPVITYQLRPDEKTEILRTTGDLLETRSARIVWVKVDENEGDLVRCFAQLGSDYCGTSLRMARWLNETLLPEVNPDIRIREAEWRDLSILRSIAGESHEHSHFLRDPNLPEGMKWKIFPSYLNRCFGEQNRPFLVAEGENKQLLGFSLLYTPTKQKELLGQTVGIVDFIGVDKQVHGKGIGSTLLAYSFKLLQEKGYSLVELKTMLDNLKAVGFYQRYGFRILSVEMHFSFGSTAAKWL
jgi:ribosomal protein S18 acetylase RimI-like enzyme